VIGAVFLFPDISDLALETPRNMLAGQQKGLVKIVNHTVAASSNIGAPMTSISATAAGSYQSPLQKLQDELQAEVNSGAISSSDQSALSSALNDINSSLQSNAASDSSSGPNASPGDLKSKIDTLIANQVSSGKLTSDQATELQGVFKAAFANGDAAGDTADGAGRAGPPDPAGGAAGSGGAGRAHHGGHHGGHGGPPAADSSSATDSASSASDILQQFLQSLQDSQSGSSSPSYSATGTVDPGTGGGASSSPLLIDYQT
jgi:hypothetical protein